MAQELSSRDPWPLGARPSGARRLPAAFLPPGLAVWTIVPASCPLGIAFRMLRGAHVPHQSCSVSSRAYARALRITVGNLAGASGPPRIVVPKAPGRILSATPCGLKVVPAAGPLPIAMGKLTRAPATPTIALGKLTRAPATPTIALGKLTRASVSLTIAIGKLTRASASLTIAIGKLKALISSDQSPLGARFRIPSF